MNPSQPPHKNAPVWPLEQPVMQTTAAKVLTSASHFSQLGCKSGPNITASKCHYHCYSVIWRQTTVCMAWVSSLESASTLQHRICVVSIAPAGTILANWAALEQPRGTARTQPCQGLCCLCSYCLPLETLLFGDSVGNFWPRSWQNFCFTKDHAIQPCRHPSVHTMCCMWVETGDLTLLESKDTRVASFFPPSFDLRFLFFFFFSKL